MFKELEKEKNSILEEKRMNHFLENDILNKSIEKGKDYFVFYDGPATANGHPGLHHMVAKFLKDTFWDKVVVSSSSTLLVFFLLLFVPLLL